MNKLFVRVNGRGNAWPVQLGKEHAFYDRTNFEDLSNASFSIVSETANKINWSVLVDGGHGAIQYLLKHENRIPEAIFITHPHHDHIYSIDWVIQSYYRKHNRSKTYPVYASKMCFDVVLQVFPHLSEMIDFKELDYGQKRSVDEIKGLYCTAFPVYHGTSAKGASMLMFEKENHKIIFSGDLLFPLLKDKDYEKISNPDLIFVDCNNRFPYPLSNHWSVVSKMPDMISDSKYLSEYIKNFIFKSVKSTHSIEYDLNIKDICLSIVDFCMKINPCKTAMVHYSGNEDLAYYQQEILTTEKLNLWLSDIKKQLKLNTCFIVPNVGDKFYLDNNS